MTDSLKSGFTIYPMSREELQRRPRLVAALLRHEEQQRGLPVLTLEQALALDQAAMRKKSPLRRRLRRWLLLIGSRVSEMGARL